MLLRLAEKGLVCADSFVPVRQWQNREKVKKATARQRVNARVMALSAGRWDVVRPVKQWSEEAVARSIFHGKWIAVPGDVPKVPGRGQRLAVSGGWS